MATSKLEITLLGPPQFRLDGTLIDRFGTRKAQALLTYLACNSRPQSRDLLAGMFWADKPEVVAKNNLRRILPDLRKHFDNYLASDRYTVMFDRRAVYSLDVEMFAAAMRLLHSSPLAPADIDALEAALTLYTGEFLAGFNLLDAPAFDDWVLLQREHLRELALRGLIFITEHFVQTRQLRRGLASSQRLLALEPWHETGYQQRMILLAWNGERGAALQQYALCTRVLADEFSLPPSAEMTELYTRIKAGEFDPVAPLIPVTAVGGDLPGSEDVPRQLIFVGRDAELAQMRAWGRGQQPAIIAVLGVGGAGKTALIARYVHTCAEGADAAASFDCVLWASLLNAPPLAALLRIWLRKLAAPRAAELPDDVEELLTQLFDYLRARRCLFVLDNLDSLLQEGDGRGHFRPGYKEYGWLLERMADIPHTSKLILTSRELPAALARRVGSAADAVRVLALGGLSVVNGAELLASTGLDKAPAALAALIRHYSGNPLALKLVADTVRDLYGGDLAAFLAQGMPVFGDIRTVLDEQATRLTELERDILCWLAIKREPVAVNMVLESLVGPLDRAALLHAVNTLLHTSLVERDQAPDGTGPVRLTLQNVVMEFTTDRLLRAFIDDLMRAAGDVFRRFPLLTVRAPEYVQTSQHRVLLQPVADQALARWGQVGAVERLRTLLAHVRAGGLAATGYAAANVLHLLLALQADLHGLDLTNVAVWQADLRTVALVGVDFSGADLTGSVFASTLGAIESITVSTDGRMCAAGGSDGAIYLWRTRDFELAAVLRCHTVVNGLQFSTDSRLLLSIGLDGLVCLWDMATMKLADSIAVSERPVLCAALHPDGTHVAAADTDETIRIWEWRTGAQRHTLQAPSVIANLAYSPDGSTLVSVGDERTICIWDVGNGVLQRVLTGHHGKVEAVAFHPAGGRFATGGEDGEIHLWDVERATPIHTLAGHTDFVLNLAFAPDGTALASCGADQTIRLWDVASGAPRGILTGHRGWVTAVAFATDGRAVLSGGYDQSVRLWDVHSGQVVRLLRGHLRWVDYVAFSNDGRLLAAGSLDGPVRLWDVSAKTLRHTLRGPEAATRVLTFSPVGDRLAAAGDDHKVRIWDVMTGTLLHTLHGHRASVRNAIFSPDGATLVTASHDHTLRLWDVATGQLQRVISNVSAASRLAVACDSQRRLLAYCTQDDTLVLAEVETGAVVRISKTGATQPAIAAFDPTGRWLACGTQTGAVLVYDLAAPADADVIYCALPETGTPVWRLLFSPDSSVLAWVCTDQEIRLLDLPTRRLRVTLPTYFGAFCVAFSRGGHNVITDGPDHTLLVRAAGDGAVLQTLRGHTATVTCIATAPADECIVSSSSDGSVRLWDLTTGGCLATLEAEGPYAGMKIADIKGVTPAQLSGLLLLGANT
jgi:WD40 repeat protein/DNA-binding SARP family transcriptional activator